MNLRYLEELGFKDADEQIGVILIIFLLFINLIALIDRVV